MLAYQRRGSDPTTLVIAHRYVPHEGTARQYTLDELSRFFERVLALPADQQQALLPPRTAAGLALGEMPPLAQELMSRYRESARLLGQRVAELHQALGAETLDPAFAPENVTALYQRALYQSMRNVEQRSLHQLARQLEDLPEELRGDAQQVLAHGDEMLVRFRSLVGRRQVGRRIRCHGNLGLGEILFTGRDFVIIDFEGEPARSLGDRRVKRLPLRDVATMVRSFHQAALGTLLGGEHRRGRTPGMIRPEDIGLLEQWAEVWYVWIATAFVRSYQEHAAGANFLPASPEEFENLLADFLLERALRELAHELDYRPAWVPVPLRAILQLTSRTAAAAT
jgi:maltose alpha-D-glucosyltransferase/alpha-amylase